MGVRHNGQNGDRSCTTHCRHRAWLHALSTTLPFGASASVESRTKQVGHNETGVLRCILDAGDDEEEEDDRRFSRTCRGDVSRMAVSKVFQSSMRVFKVSYRIRVPDHSIWSTAPYAISGPHQHGPVNRLPVRIRVTVHRGSPVSHAVHSGFRPIDDENRCLVPSKHCRHVFAAHRSVTSPRRTWKQWVTGGLHGFGSFVMWFHMVSRTDAVERPAGCFLT